MQPALTLEDVRLGMRQIEPQIRRYASLIVRKGVNVQAGQQVVVQCPSSGAMTR